MENEDKTTLVTETTTCQNLIQDPEEEDQDIIKIPFMSDYETPYDPEIASKSYWVNFYEFRIFYLLSINYR